MQINMQLQAGALLSFLSPGLPLCLAFLLLPAQWLRGGYVPEIVLLKEEVHLCCPEEWEMSQQRWVKLHPVRGTPLTFQEIYFEPHIRNQLENKEKTSNRRVLQKQIEFRITEQKRNPCEDSDHQLHILIWSISAHGKWQVAAAGELNSLGRAPWRKSNQNVLGERSQMGNWGTERLIIRILCISLLV